jgi:hypothetical protein
MSRTVVATLSQSARLPLGASPALVAVSGGEALLVVAPVEPVPGDTGFTIRPTDAPLLVPASGTMWATACTILNTRAIVLPTVAAE